MNTVQDRSAATLELDVQQLLRRVIRVQEDERARIARDLHDQVGQDVTALRLLLERQQAECCVNSRIVIEKALALVREIDDDIDSLARVLRPVAVSDLGLAGSLQQLARQWASTAHIDADCHCDIAESPLSPDAEVTVYRVAQEALHNVLKHAHATRVSIIGEVSGGSMVLVVEDNGVGFDVSKQCDAVDGMGLSGMRERAALVGGTLHVASVSGKGTTVSLRIPTAAAA